MLTLDSLEITPAKLVVAPESDLGASLPRHGGEGHPKDFATVLADLDADEAAPDPKLAVQGESITLPDVEVPLASPDTRNRTEVAANTEALSPLSAAPLPVENAEPKPPLKPASPDPERSVETQKIAYAPDLESGPPTRPDEAETLVALATPKVSRNDVAIPSNEIAVAPQKTTEASSAPIQTDGGETNPATSKKIESNQAQKGNFQSDQPDSLLTRRHDQHPLTPLPETTPTDGQSASFPEHAKRVSPVQFAPAPSGRENPEGKPDIATAAPEKQPSLRSDKAPLPANVETVPLPTRASMQVESDQAPATSFTPARAVPAGTVDTPARMEMPLAGKDPFTASPPLMNEQRPKPTPEAAHPVRDVQMRDAPQHLPSLPAAAQTQLGVSVPTSMPSVTNPEVAQLAQTTLAPLEPELTQLHAPTSLNPQSRTATPIPSTHAPQVAAQIATAVAQIGSGTTQIILNPEELGRVRLTLTTTEYGIAVAVAADRPETIDLMRRHVDLLVQEFEDLDRGGIDFQFHDQDSNSGETESNSNTSNPVIDDENTRLTSPTPILTAAPSGGLDLKL